MFDSLFCWKKGKKDGKTRGKNVKYNHEKCIISEMSITFNEKTRWSLIFDGIQLISIECECVSEIY